MHTIRDLARTTATATLTGADLRLALAALDENRVYGRACCKVLRRADALNGPWKTDSETRTLRALLCVVNAVSSRDESDGSAQCARKAADGLTVAS